MLFFGNESNPNGWKQWSLHLCLIGLFAGVVFFTNLGSAQLWDRDEPRNAGCAAEMMARGDWVVPIFNDELRHQKPILLYWLIMSGYSVLGQTELAARIWSAILGTGTAFLTYGLARRLTNPTVALLATIALCTSLMFSVASRAATPDAVLIFCSTLALYFYVLGTFAAVSESEGLIEPKHADTWFPVGYGYVLAMYAAMGLGVLAKGPVGALVPCAIIGMFMLIQRLPVLSPEFSSRQGQLSHAFLAVVRPFAPKHFLKTVWAMRPLTAAVIILAIAAPWYVLVGVRTDGEFLSRFLIGENFGRATSTFENHGGGWWYYPVAILAGFFPWTIFAVPVAITTDRLLSRKSRYRVSVVLLACWVCVQIGLFTLASTKLPSYVTPCYPALAILTALYLNNWATRECELARVWCLLAISVLVTVGIALTAGLAYVGVEFLDGNWLIALVGPILIAGGIAAIYFAWFDKREATIHSIALTAVVFATALFGFGTVAVDSTRQTQALLDRVRATDAESKLATYRCLESSWVVYSGRPIYELDPNSASVSLERQVNWETKPRLTPEAFLQNEPNALFLTTDEHLAELQARLSPDFQVVKTAPFFLKPDRQLVLLSRINPPDRMASQPLKASAIPEHGRPPSAQDH